MSFLLTRSILPNPVAELQIQSLADQKDADYAALQPAYHVVTLTNLDGSGYLRGDWANARSSTGTRRTRLRTRKVRAAFVARGILS